MYNNLRFKIYDKRLTQYMYRNANMRVTVNITVCISLELLLLLFSGVVKNNSSTLRRVLHFIFTWFQLSV